MSADISEEPCWRHVPPIELAGRGRKRIGRPIIDVAICLQIMYDITDEELDE